MEKYQVPAQCAIHWNPDGSAKVIVKLVGLWHFAEDGAGFVTKQRRSFVVTNPLDEDTAKTLWESHAMHGTPESFPYWPARKEFVTEAMRHEGKGN
jgi:hypothetical protein